MAGVLPSPVPLNQYIAATMSSSSSSSSVSSSTSTISAVNAGNNYHTNHNNNFKSTFLTSSNNSCQINANSNNINSNNKKNHQPVNNFKIVPSLRIKTNELFYKYLSDKERTDQIKEIINYIKQNNQVPKINELQSFNNKDSSKIKTGLLSLNSLIGSSNDVLQLNQSHQLKQPPLHQQNGNSTSSISNNSIHSNAGYINNQQINNIASSLNNLVNSHLRSKSPPSLHSPPMSPISRTPNSPKSPRQRQSLLNNGNTNNSSIINSALKIVNSFNKDQRPQSPNTPRDQNDKLKTATTVTAPTPAAASTISSSAPTTPTPVTNNNVKVAVKPKNEKEIQIQRVSSSPTPSPSNELLTNNKLKLSQPTTTLTSQSLPVSVNQTDLNKDLAPSKTPVNVANTPQLNGELTKQSLNTTNVQAIAATVAASIESAAAKAKIQQQNAQMNSKILATLNSKIQQKQALIPQFHFPSGKPDEKQFKPADDTETMKLVSAEFRLQKEGKIYKETFADIMKIIGLPRYWKTLLFRSCTLNNKLNYVTYSSFEQVWTKLNQTCHDRPSLFMKLISTSNNTIVYDDWEPLMQDIVDTHPGLKFLHDHKEFHTRYIKTVIARIYYTVNRSWSGKITLTELKRSNFLSVLESLELEDDINLIKDYFSYEHFYVIYCKFWELDKDHDLLISKEDLYRHNNFAISPRVIDRIFSGTVIRGKDWRDNLMSYYDFVWFLISEEDKRNATSIEYWFRVLDLDGDGVLSMYELEYFYNEQIEQMRERQIEYMPFTDLLCQILDLVKPSESGKIHLKDLKQCKMTNVFFDTFINLEKYLEYEQRDPFSNMRDLEGPELSDWEKYAADEYENLVSEDVNADNQDFNYEDDFEDENMYNNGNNPNGNFNNLGTNGTTNNVNQANSVVGQQPQQPQGSWNNNLANSLAGDSQTASTTGAGNRNRLLINSSPTSPTSLNSPNNTNTSSFITNRSSFDER